MKLPRRQPHADEMSPAVRGLSKRIDAEQTFEDGDCIVAEGSHGRAMYIVAEGRVRIVKSTHSGDVTFGYIERGDFFGEMSLIDGEPRSADARAHGGPLTVLALDQGTVREILAMDPHAAVEFLQLLCRLVAGRLREIDEKVIGWRIMSGERNEAASA